MECSRLCYPTHHASIFLFHSYQLLVILVFGPNQHEVTYENKTVSFKELNPIIETSKMFTKLSKCNILPPVLNKLIWRSVLHCRSGRHVMLELANSAREAKEWDRRLVLLSSEGQSELESYYHNLHHLFKWISSLKICDRYFSWFFFWPLYSHHLRHYLAIYCFPVLDLNLFVLFHLLLITHFNVFFTVHPSLNFKVMFFPSILLILLSVLV